MNIYLVYLVVISMVQDIDSLKSECHNGEMEDVSSSSRASMLQDSSSAAFLSNLEFDDADIDDGLDPALKEEIDRFFSLYFIV